MGELYMYQLHVQASSPVTSRVHQPQQVLPVTALIDSPAHRELAETVYLAESGNISRGDSRHVFGHRDLTEISKYLQPSHCDLSHNFSLEYTICERQSSLQQIEEVEFNQLLHLKQCHK